MCTTFGVRASPFRPHRIEKAMHDDRSYQADQLRATLAQTRDEVMQRLRTVNSAYHRSEVERREN